MATIIDSLVLELGLDGTKFSGGAKKIVEDAKKSEEELRKSGKNIEDYGKRASAFFSQLRNQVIGLYAAFTAGRGLKEFAQDITHTNAQMGYLAKRLDMSVGDLAAFGGAMKSLGGTAEDAESTFQAWSDDFQQLGITGNSQFIPIFRNLGIHITDSNGKLISYTDRLDKLNQVFSKMDPARAAAWGKQLGITPKMMDLLLKTPDQYHKIIAAQEQLRRATEADAKSAQTRETAWNRFILTASALGTHILTVLTPAFDSVLGVLQNIADWFNEHPAAIEAAFAAITGLVVLLTAAIGVGLVKGALGQLVEGFGIVRMAGMATFSPVLGTVGLLAKGLSGLLLSLATMSATAFPALSEALLGVGAAIEATPIGWIVTGLAAVSAVIYEIYEHWTDLKRAFGFGGTAPPVAKTNPLEQAAKEENTARPGIVPAASPVRPSRSTVAPAAQSDIDTLTKMGWTRNQAIGILANVQRESGGRTNAVGDKGAAYGMAQWHPDRQADFAKWAGHDIRQSTREEQLGFINFELREGSRKKAGQALAGATSAQSAAQIVSRLYEAPYNANREATTRASIAAAMAALPNSALALAGGGARLGANYDQRSHNITSEVHVGQVVVQTQATDAAGIVQDIKPALMRESWVAAINSGPS